jgi:hypothetical protein
MSEIDDLMVGVMLHKGDDAEYAVVRLINLAESGEITEKHQRHIMKAVERRLKKEHSGTDIYDLLMRLSEIIDPSSKPETADDAQLPPEIESPDAVLARRMRGDSTPANYEAEEPEPSSSDIQKYIDSDRIPPNSRNYVDNIPKKPSPVKNSRTAKIRITNQIRTKPKQNTSPEMCYARVGLRKKAE